MEYGIGVVRNVSTFVFALQELKTARDKDYTDKSDAPKIRLLY
jgi:hypothetical protein